MLIFFFITDGETKQATALTPRISYKKALCLRVQSSLTVLGL